MFIIQFIKKFPKIKNWKKTVLKLSISFYWAFLSQEYKMEKVIEIVGLLFFLMIYNRTVVTVHFPRELYQKLFSKG